MFAQVIIDQDVKAIDKIFEYNIPSNMSILVGMRVHVPFGKRVLQGYVISISEDCSYDKNI